MKKLGVVVAFLFVVCVCTAIGQSKDLNVPLIKQTRSQWCWAACIEMVDRYYNGNSAIPQCMHVKYYLDTLAPKIIDTLKCPCTPGAYDEKLNNMSGNTYFSFSVSYFGPRYERILSKVGLYSSFEEAPTLAEIKNELDHDRPLIAYLKMSKDATGANHIVVVKGYLDSIGQTFLRINDPWLGNPTIDKLNYTALTQTSNALPSFVAFQMNIHPKNMLVSPPTGSIFRRMNNLNYTEDHSLDQSTSSATESDTIHIRVKVFSVDALGGLFPHSYNKKFLDNELVEIYSPSTHKSYVKERIDSVWTITEFKNAAYPLSFSMNKGKDTTMIDNIKGKNITIWRYPSPPFAYFYALEQNGKTLVTPLTTLDVSKGKREKKLEFGTIYSPSKVTNKLNTLQKFFFGKKILTNLNPKKNILGIKH